jgi:predicted RNA binding protein YcfA (HicA-like mRNA interferase family)
MKRKKLIRHLEEQGCIMEREGAKHTLYYNPAEKASATVPRHNEINTFTAKNICKALKTKIIEGK